MDCPFCGYEPAASPCPLCGEAAGEPDLFQRTAPARYRITMILPPGPEVPPELRARAAELADAAVFEPGPPARARHYLLFSLDRTDALLQAVGDVNAVGGVELRFNGQPYPCAHELWLPLLRLFAAG